MIHLFFVAMGGFIGAGLRFIVTKNIFQYVPNLKFPLGTFVVNVLGCFIAGILSALMIKHNYFSANVRLFLITGILGGFTTFSTLIMDSFYLVKKNEFLSAISYSGLTFTFGFILMLIGFYIIMK